MHSLWETQKGLVCFDDVHDIITSTVNLIRVAKMALSDIEDHDQADAIDGVLGIAWDRLEAAKEAIDALLQQELKQAA